MPKKVENKLKREAAKKGFTGKRADKYVYGTMNKLGLLETGGNKPRAPKRPKSK